MNTLQDIKRDELNQIKFINKIKLKIFMKKNKNIKIKQKKTNKVTNNTIKFKVILNNRTYQVIRIDS